MTDSSIGGFAIGVSGIGSTSVSYVSLITSEHRDKPDFAATVLLSAQPFVDAQNVTFSLVGVYDLDVSVGAQEDADGLWIGISRYVATPLTGVYFSWDTVGLGWEQGVWRGPFDPVDGLVRLDDDTYRLLLRAKIAANSWDGTVVGAAAAYALMFNNSTTPGTTIILQDNQDMTMLAVLAGTWPPAPFRALFLDGALPLKPMGVEVTYEIVTVDGAPAFGWDVQNSGIAGWDTGAWVAPDIS